MTGPKVLKSVCFKCKINKWVVDFREGCCSKISSMSVCLSCEQAALIEAQKKEIESLKSREQEREGRIRKLEDFVSKIEKMISKDGELIGIDLVKENNPRSSLDGSLAFGNIKELEKVVMENRDEIVETGKQVVEIREEIASIKDHESFQVVKGRKATKISEKRQGITLTNRYGPLKDETDISDATSEVEAYVIGDSIVREQSNHFARRCKQSKVQSFPGCKADKIRDVVKAIKVHSKNTCIIVNAGNNDLYLRGDKVGNTEPLVNVLECTVDSLAEKTDRGALLGIMPRVYTSHFAMSKAIGVNERLGKYCQEKEVKFIDVWDAFIGKRHFFRRDGVHLNEAGHKKLGEILGREQNSLKERKKSIPRTPDQGIQTHAVPVEANGFEGFPKGN